MPNDLRVCRLCRPVPSSACPSGSAQDSALRLRLAAPSKGLDKTGPVWYSPWPGWSGKRVVDMGAWWMSGSRGLDSSGRNRFGVTAHLPASGACASRANEQALPYRNGACAATGRCSAVEEEARLTFATPPAAIAGAGWPLTSPAGRAGIGDFYATSRGFSYVQGSPPQVLLHR